MTRSVKELKGRITLNKYCISELNKTSDNDLRKASALEFYTNTLNILEKELEQSEIDNKTESNNPECIRVIDTRKDKPEPIVVNLKPAILSWKN